MSVVPSQLPSAGGKNTVGIFGRRVSTDALLLAGASVVAIILLYRAGRPAQTALQPLSLSGDGSTLTTPGLPSNALIASSPAPSPSSPPVGSSGVTTQRGASYQWVELGPGQSINDAAALFARTMGGQQSDILGRLQFFDPSAQSDPVSGGTFFALPLNVPGYREGDLPAWQRLIVPPGGFGPLPPTPVR